MEKKMGKRSRFRWGQFFLHLVTLIFLFLVLYPLWITLIKSFKTVDQDYANPFGITFPFLWDNYALAWEVVSPMIWNTVIVAVPITAAVLLVDSITAYAFVRFRFPFKETLFMIIMSIMMIPGVLTLLSQYAMINAFRMVNNRLGVILPAIAGSIPWGVFLLRTFFKGVPNDLFEAASIDGASSVHMYLHIMLPLSLPILFTLGLNCFLGEWNNLVWPRLVLLDEDLFTITIGLMPFTSQYYQIYHSYTVPLAGYMIVSLPLIVIFFFTSKQFIRGMTSGALKM